MDAYGYETRGFADLHALSHLIADFNRAFSRAADMLRERNNQK
jgi:hypothetical protein